MEDKQTFCYYKCIVCSEHFANECNFLTHAINFHCKVLITRGYNTELENAFQDDAADTADCVKSEFPNCHTSDGDIGSDYTVSGNDVSFSINLATENEHMSNSSTPSDVIERMGSLATKDIDPRTGYSVCEGSVFNVAAVQQVMPQVAETGKKLKSFHTEHSEKVLAKGSYYSETMSEHTEQVVTCGEAYLQREKLKHKPSLLCKFCGKVFRNIYNRKRHEHIHTGVKPYKCNVCCKRFIESGALKLHIRTHSGEKPYECYMCHKLFSQVAHVKSHMRLHTGERPYKCELCDKDYKQLSSLASHKNNKHY